MGAGHWTFGECSSDEESCLNAMYDSSNITEITGVQLGRLDPDSIEAALLESLTLPMVDSMNCEELLQLFILRTWPLLKSRISRQMLWKR